ncbi:MAG: hypothetical protein JW801_06240 [Bacteroidales bacterium]|nr:hypothetical protein [Bacteroidales bacterium]
MKSFIYIMLLAFPGTNLLSQTNTLSEQLWDRVSECYSMFEDMDEDGEADYNQIIDDSRNGYLMIDGDWPTCGCGCRHIAGAYKDSEGNYTFLEKETWNCSWVHKIKSNRDLHKVFPDDMNDAFIPYSNTYYIEHSTPFYLDVEIPQHGTDTRVTLKVIPFGINLEGGKLISYGYFEDDCAEGCQSVNCLERLAQKVEDDNSLVYLAEGDLGKISGKDMEHIRDIIASNNDGITSPNQLTEALQNIRSAYQFYQKVQHEYLILGWDRHAARFYIKEKGAAPEVLTFREFIIRGPYWNIMC